MDKRVVAGLAGVVAGLSAYLYFVERGALSSKELDERKGRALGSFVRPRVSELSVKHAGQTLTLLRKPGPQGDFGAFTITAPLADEADEGAVDSLLGELEWLSARRVIDTPSAKDLGEFGLDAPAYELSYVVTGDRHTLKLGKADVHGESYYARLDDEPRVLVVPKTVLEALDHSPGHFRSKAFLGEITSAWARKLDVTQAGSTIGAEKENGRFWITNAPKSYADDARVRAIVSALDGVRATRYLEGEALARASGPALVPASSVALKTVPDEAREDQKPAAFQLTVYGPCPEHADERVARAGEKGDLVCVLTSSITPLLDVGDLREHHLLPFDPSEVERVVLTGAGLTYDVKREGAGWKSEKAPDAIDGAALSAWLGDLRALEGTYAAPEPYAAGAHHLVLSLAGDRRVSLSFRSGAGGETTVVREGENIALRYAGDASALLAVGAGRFPALAFWGERKPSDVRAVTAAVGAQKRALTLVDGSFRAGAKAEPVADTLRVRELVRGLLKSKARAYVGGALPSHAFQAARASVELDVGDGALALVFGADAADGTIYARVDGARVFRVDPETLASVYELAGVPVPESLAVAMGQGEAEEEDEDEHGHHDHE